MGRPNCNIHSESKKTVPLYIFHCYILQYICNKTHLQQNPRHISYHTLNVSLHYLAEYKLLRRPKLAKFCYTQHSKTCLMFKKLTNKTIQYALLEC